jgi:hypothetical protein
LSRFCIIIKNEWKRKKTIIIINKKSFKVYFVFFFVPERFIFFFVNRVLLSLPTYIQMRRCDDTITFSPTIRILKTTIIGPLEGRFIPEDKLTITPRNGFLVKVYKNRTIKI